MEFGSIPVRNALGATLAHSVRTPAGKLAKGSVVTEANLEALEAAGISSVIAGRFGPDDIPEDEAARRLAKAIAGKNVRVAAAHTGRVNLFAEQAGVLCIDRALIDRLNRVDEAITIATLNAHTGVSAGQMVATVKIIPLAAPAPALAECEQLARDSDVLDVAPYRSRRIGLVQTQVADTKPSILEKTRAVTNKRLMPLGMNVAVEKRCSHTTEAVEGELRTLLDHGVELILMVGASAIIDRRDVLPGALVGVGGQIDRFGMPVDPGNLLMLGHVGQVAVLGLPGCARSIKANGFDWVLERLLADVPITSEDIGGMGVGGLLSEIPSRPQPRTKAAEPAKRTIAAIVLAAGQSRRMGRENKLLAPLNGKPMVAWAVDAALGSTADEVLVVTGHDADPVRTALSDYPVQFAHCEDANEGLSRSLASGLKALDPSVSAAAICLGDMPYVVSSDINRLIEAYNPADGASIIVTTHQGKRGNPVLWDRRYFDEMIEISGDVGARHLIGVYEEAVRDVAADDGQKLVDIDTPEALAAARVGKAG
ncbi:MAG: molybdopterin-binding/glycosyltransferase family 2 protein [Pseudomonadota bacterium]